MEASRFGFYDENNFGDDIGIMRESYQQEPSLYSSKAIGIGLTEQKLGKGESMLNVNDFDPEDSILLPYTPKVNNYKSTRQINPYY